MPKRSPFDHDAYFGASQFGWWYESSLIVSKTVHDVFTFWVDASRCCRGGFGHRRWKLQGRGVGLWEPVATPTPKPTPTSTPTSGAAGEATGEATEKLAKLRADVEAHPESTVRERTERMGIPRSSLHRLLADLAAEAEPEA